jgi:hypothetical protein
VAERFVGDAIVAEPEPIAVFGVGEGDEAGEEEDAGYRANDGA